MIKSCIICGKAFKIKPSHYEKRITCSRTCRGKHDHLTKKGKKRGYPTWTKDTHPEVAEKISKYMKLNLINVGMSNVMKRPEVRKKMSVSRKKMLEEPEIRKTISEKTKQAWIDGKFEGVRVGQCKWFNYELKSGEKIKVQGTWELAFAKWADNHNLNIIVHKGRLDYIDGYGQNRSYYPDFFVENWNCYVEIKNDYHYSQQKGKFDSIIKCNPNLKLRILLREDLTNLGIL